MFKKENIILVSILIFLVILITASQFEAKNKLEKYLAKGGDSTQVKKKEDTKKIKIPLRKFKHIIFEDKVNVTLIKAANYEINCSEKDDVLSKINMKSDTVVISGDVTFFMKVRNLNSIKVAGNAILNLSGFYTDTCSVNTSGNGSLNVQNSDFQVLNILSTGNSVIIIKKSKLEKVNINIKNTASITITSKVSYLFGRVDASADLYVSETDSLSVKSENGGLSLSRRNNNY